MTLREDICSLPSFEDGSVDCAVSTSAFHHLPGPASLRQALRRVNALLRPGEGSLYIFDFGLLKSPKTRALLVREVAKAAPPVTAHDYGMSLQASFPIDDGDACGRGRAAHAVRRFVQLARRLLLFPADPAARACPPHARAYMGRAWEGLPAAARLEHWMLRAMRRKRR